MTDPTEDADDGHEPHVPQRSKALQEHDDFVSGVMAECLNPGVQQALRRALAKPVDTVPARTHAALLRPGLIPYKAAKDKRPYYAVAALIAARPRAQRATESGVTTTPEVDEAEPIPTTPKNYASGFRPYGTNLGESIALAVTRGDNALKENGAEGRLHLMVRQDVDGLHRMLPGVVRLVTGAGVHLDYACLLGDLRSWPTRRDEIVTRWLERYYRTLGSERARTEADSSA